MGVLGILVTLKALPNATERSVQAFDFSGFLWLVIAMVGLFLGIESFASTAHSHWQGLALIGLGLFSSAIYAYHAHTHQMPCFVVDYLKNNIYAIGI